MPWSWCKKSFERGAGPAAALGSLPCPSREECLALMASHDMPPQIREHSLRVMEVARHLGEALVEAGFFLHLPLLEAGALLHDLGKAPCLGTAGNHAEWGAAVLEELGYPQVAQIVREHIRLASPPADPRPLREAEVVFYADKRVLYTGVVPLARRFADLRERYGRTPEILVRIGLAEKASRILEEKIFAPLSIDPEDLLQLNHLRREA